MKQIKIDRTRTTPFDVIVCSVFALLALITLYPFYNVVILSVSNTVATATHTPYILPYTVDFAGYESIMADAKFVRALGTSCGVTVIGTLVNLFLSITGAYVLSRRELVGRKFFLSLILFTMLFNGGMVPTYMIVKSFGLINSFWSMIFPAAISTYYLIIMKNYFMNLPQSLFEAADLDGANQWTILWKIALPISKPFIATFTLFYSVERWNEWYNAMLYINQSKLQPLQIYLREILINLNSQLSVQAQQMVSQTMKLSSSSVQMAAIVITTVPIMCVYPFLQKYFVNGVMVGGIKE